MPELPNRPTSRVEAAPINLTHLSLPWSRWMAAGLLVLALLAALAIGAPALGQESFSGELNDEDEVLDGGEFYDVYEFELSEGDVILAELEGEAFDTFLAVVRPNGEDIQNDDHGDTSHSMVEMTAEEAGTYTVLVTSFSAGEEGAYNLVVTINGDEVDPAEGDGDPAPNRGNANPGVAANRVLLDQRGRLSEESLQSFKGEYYEEWVVDVVAGQTVKVEMTSDNFDCYLVVLMPNGERESNDDGGDGTNSMIQSQITENGELRVFTSSFSEGGTGRFEVVITVVNEPAGAGGPDASESGNAVDETAELAEGDETLGDGQFADEYTFDANAGDPIVVRMQSEAVDTFLTLTSPSGKVWTNDDYRGRVDLSQIDAEADETGTYTVQATSYEAGESGAYTLRISVAGEEGGSTPDNDGAGVTPDDPDAEGPADDMDEGDADEGDGEDAAEAPEPTIIEGELNADDETLPTRESFEEHTVEMTEGQSATITLESDDFDTYLVVIGPDGETWENDDADGSLAMSRVELSNADAGEYTIRVQSFSPGETGDFVLTIQPAE